jgi:hypothetical protein
MAIVGMLVVALAVGGLIFVWWRERQWQSYAASVRLASVDGTELDAQSPAAASPAPMSMTSPVVHAAPALAQQQPAVYVQQEPLTVGDIALGVLAGLWLFVLTAGVVFLTAALFFAAGMKNR